jgi:hypothetical protein
MLRAHLPELRLGVRINRKTFQTHTPGFDFPDIDSVGMPLRRELEQGKAKLRREKVNQVL